MTAMKGDVVNRVRRLPKPTKSAEALQPLFEAVSNAVHAVEDLFQQSANERGEVIVTMSGLKTPEQFEAVISDNGLGLDPDRYAAFCTTDTNFKLERGGKGVGRLLWLDAFETITVRSVYKRDGALYQREFSFRLHPLDQIVDEQEQLLTDQSAPTGTIVSLRGLRGVAYQAKFPNRAATVIRHFGSHFLADFILGKSPKITLTADGQTANFPEDVKDLLVEDRGIVELVTEEFGKLTLARFVCKKEASADFDGTHQLHYVANSRTVITRKIDGLLGIEKFGEANDHVYHGCIAGDFLNDRVNQERTAFNFDEKTAEDIAKVCATSIRERLHEVVDKRNGITDPSMRYADGRIITCRNDFGLNLAYQHCVSVIQHCI